MSNALMKRMGIKETQVTKPTRSKSKGKDTGDSLKVKDVRGKMHNAFLQGTDLISGTYFKPIPKRDSNDKIVKKDGKNVIESYETSKLNGQFILEDNEDGTFTATRLNVFKEQFILDGESLDRPKVTEAS